jgi:tetratricopeptide (TPR) repeat protein
MPLSSGSATLALVVILLVSASAATSAAASDAQPPGPAAAGVDPLPGTPDAKAQAAEHRAKGEAAAALGRFAEAERELSQALALDPGDAVAKQELARALFGLASASRKAQQYAQAADAFQRYTALRPDEPAGYFGLADALRQSGKPLEALAAYSTYVQKEDRPSEQASVARAKERIAELQKVVRGGAAAAPAGSPAPTAPAVPPAVAGAGAGAPDPGSGVVVRKLGDELPDAGAAEAAAAAAAADVAASRIIDGDLSFATKDYRMALFAYQDAILAQPGNAKARFKAGQAYARLGYDEEAIGQWNHVLVLEPQNPDVHELIAQAQARNAQRARQKVARGPLYGAGLPASGPPLPWATPVPNRPSPAAGATSPEAAATAEVRKHYAAGVALVRSAAGATGDQRAKAYKDAIAELDLALSGRPAYAVALIARGSARLGLGQLQEAAQDYSAAHEADPALAAPLFGLAEAYRGQGQAQKAADLYREFASSTAPDADAELKAYALQTAQTLAPR